MFLFQSFWSTGKTFLCVCYYYCFVFFSLNVQGVQVHVL